MLTSTRKPGPPVPPRPSAAAVANALAKHRENSPSNQQQHHQISGVHTLKPPHPGRTVVYKSPAFDQQVIKKPQSGDPREPLGASKTELYVGESHGIYSNNVPRPVLPSPPATTISTNNSSNLENGKLMYTSTCSIIEINSSSSASTSASSSPVSTLQKTTTDSKATNLLGIGGGHRNHFNSADEEDDTSICQKQLKNTYNHRHHHQLLDPLDNSANDGDLIAIKRNSPDVIVISSSSEHDSGTEHNSMDTNSIASSNSLERENNLKNREPSRTSHLTEIIIGSDLVTNGATATSTIIEATNHVIRSSSIRLPYRPEPEGGEHVTPSNDANSVVKVTPPPIDPSTLDSKLSEKKVAFHELLISELTAMRSAAAAATGGHSDSIVRRQRKPPENRSSPEISPTGTARIRTADWIEVGDNGKEVVLSSCQISLEDSGLEDEGKHDEDDDGGSSGVGDSWDSVKDAEERITMSLPGLPPLPKSLSGFDLAGQQLQSHQQHHHQNHHHHQQHHPPQHQPPAPPPQYQQHQQHQQQHLQPPQQQHQQQQQQPHPQQQQPLPPSLNHHPTNPFIPIGVNLQSVSMASLVSQRGQSPVSSTVSSSSMAATPNSGSGSGGGGISGGSQQGAGSAVRKPTTLDTQLAILRREMYGLRQLDLSLLSQLWALNESIQEFRTMLQEQETLSPPSPTPSNSDANSVSSDDDEDDSSNTQTVGAGAILTNHHHNLIESVAAASVLSSAAAQTASSRMRAPPPPPPNRKAPSRPV